MDKSQALKWAYTFTLLLITMGWAVFLVFFVHRAITGVPGPLDVVGAAGVGVLLGALIAWNGNVNQFWFRKKEGSTPPAPDR
ncbi:hypothetical protein LCGC14_1111840 [marine sediment metagenome]|uniref:Uncharacterized protein n=1 Tax=marine sediment metagenome TaxID=412755 RepID=A0A0F9QCM2_9ZZZZ